MPATVAHSLTMTTPDNPAYENQPQHWNSNHAVTLNVLATEISALFSNKNGVSFGLDGTNVTASIAAGGAPGSISAGTTNVALGEAVFSNSNGISFGLDGATVTAQHNGLTSQSNQNVTAANGGFAFQTLSFSNANAFSFGTSAGSAVTGSYTVPVQSNGILDVSTATQSGTATSRFAMHDHQHRGVRGIAVQGTASTFFGDYVLSAGANITLATAGASTAGSVQISAAAQTNQSAIRALGVSNTGNTAGNTGVSTGIDWVIAGTNNVTVSQSTAVGGPNTIWLSAPNAGGGGGVTMERWPDYVTLAGQSMNSGTTGATGGSTQVTVSLKLAPLQMQNYLTYNIVQHRVSAQTVAGTGSASIIYFGGLYTRNASTLSLITDKTWQFAMVMSQNSVSARTVSWWWGTNSTSNSSSLSGNVSGSFTGDRAILCLTTADSLTPGQYWLMAGHIGRTSGANINSSASFMGNSLRANALAQVFGANTLANTLFQIWPFGHISATTNTNVTGLGVFPASIHTSAFTTQIASNWAPEVFFHRSV